ncbi:MAG: PGPGW domain-containing protein [Nitrospirota bacterium]|nr:PGPGW domain-containing protein [Nitrospirota bacterium]MDH4359343.1 PGPGW domain-containing protein [Nitrospirota bacterium]MDH5296984.1 PGPGW domain-containing protein [Nitrospirota bacterium]
MIDHVIQFAESLVPREVWISMITFSLLAFVGTLIAIPAILIRLPQDYFQNHGHRKWFANHHPVIRTIGLMVKNGLGLIFLVAGIAMLVLPGQGLLTMLLGILFLDFPGKDRLEQKLIRQPHILKAVNTLREKADKPPFVFNENTPT